MQDNSSHRQIRILFFLQKNHLENLRFVDEIEWVHMLNLTKTPWGGLPLVCWDKLKDSFWNQFVDELQQDVDCAKVLGLSPESLGVTKFACDPKQDEDASCFSREEIVRNRHVFAELVTQLAADDPHKPFYTELYMFVYNVHPETMDFKVRVKRIEAPKTSCESVIYYVICKSVYQNRQGWRGRPERKSTYCFSPQTRLGIHQLLLLLNTRSQTPIIQVPTLISICRFLCWLSIATSHHQ